MISNAEYPSPYRATPARVRTVSPGPARSASCIPMNVLRHDGRANVGGEMPYSERQSLDAVDGSVSACSAGSDALGACYARYAAMLARRAMRFTADRDVADDMVQETFIRACDVHAFADGQQPHPSWLLRVCDRICVDNLRRDARRWRTDALVARSLAELECEMDRDDLGEDVYSDYLEAATNIVVALPSRKREIAILHFFCGKSAADIAHSLAIKPNTVWTRLHEIRALLRRCMAARDCRPCKGSADADARKRAAMKRWGESLLAGLASREG